MAMAARPGAVERAYMVESSWAPMACDLQALVEACLLICELCWEDGGRVKVAVYVITGLHDIERLGTKYFAVLLSHPLTTRLYAFLLATCCIYQDIHSFFLIGAENDFHGISDDNGHGNTNTSE